MRLLYNLAISTMALGAKLGSLNSPKLRQLVEGRKGVFTTLENFRKREQGSLVWFHVASLGEYEQAKPVIKAFKASYPEWRVCLSFFSPSGYEHVIKKPQPFVDFITYLPFDTTSNAARFVSLLSPSAVFFVKYDLWANYIRSIRERGIPLFLIAASFRKDHVYFKGYGGFFRKMLFAFDHIFTQHQAAAALLKGIGYDRVTVAGDPRYDNVDAISQSPRAFPELEKAIQKPVVVAGSVWQEDMDILIPYINGHPEYQYILAPHDIHSDKINDWVRFLSNKVFRYSQLAEKEDPTAWDIIIIDNIGMLSSLYQYAKVAYVGGAFGKGLHNILEPLAFRIPVLFGKLKRASKFPEWAISQQQGCGFAVQSTGDVERIMGSLNDGTVYKNACDAAEQLLRDNLGSSDKIIETVKQIVAS